MNIDDGGSSRRARGPPRSQTMQMQPNPNPHQDRIWGRTPSLRGGDAHDPRYAPQGGMRAAAAPPPPHQRMPPPRGSMPGRGGFQVGRGPPVRQQYVDPYQEQQYGGGNGNGFVDERRGSGSETGYGQEGFAPPPRSMTMPPGAQYQQQQQQQQQRQYPPQSYPQQPLQYQQQQQPQYVAYNAAQQQQQQQQPPVNFSAPRAYARPPPQLQDGYGRESVGALLDEYYDEPDYAEAYNPEAGVQGGHYEDPYAPGPAPGYYQKDGRYDGAVEMPGDLPAEALPVMTANGFPPPADSPPVMTANGFPPPQVQVQVQSAPAGPARPMPQPLQQQQQQYPTRGASVSADSLPYHPSPASTRFSSDSGRQSDHTTSTGRHSDLPAHPPPVRAGLLQAESTPLPNHPPPRRQYSPERKPSSVQQGGPITQGEFDAVRQNAQANPGDQRLQLLLARKMVEAAAHLADEGGRADQKTARRNRENWIYDAHKIVKKLTNGVCIAFASASASTSMETDGRARAIRFRTQCSTSPSAIGRACWGCRLTTSAHSTSISPPRN